MEFKDRLNERMALMGLNPDQLAGRMAEYGSDVQGQSVRLWAKGRTMPRTILMPALTRALKCELEDLIPLPRAEAVH